MQNQGSNAERVSWHLLFYSQVCAELQILSAGSSAVEMQEKLHEECGFSPSLVTISIHICGSFTNSEWKFQFFCF